MRYLLASLALFVACAAPDRRDPDLIVSERYAPPPSEPVSLDPATVAKLTEAMASASVRTLRVMGAPPVEQPAQVLSDSELSVTVVGHYAAMQTRDKSWLVQVGPNTRITAYNSSNGAVGAALNLRGFNDRSVLEMQVALPKPVTAGDALVVVSASPPGSFSGTDEAMAVVFVPFDLQPGLLRGPAIGDGFLARFFRVNPISEAMVDMSRCPSVIDMGRIYKPTGPIDPAGWGAARPTIAGLLAEIGKFSGEVVDGWPVHYHAPSKQHRGYGTFFAGQTSTALCVLMSTLPVEERRPLALALVQRGLDQIGATCDGRKLYPLGGHCQGRKALVLLTGHLLKVEEICAVSAIFPNVFAEDIGFQSQPWWFGAGWTAGWSFTYSAPWDGRLLATHPSTWGDRNAPNHDTWNWLFGYYGQVVPSQVGTALAMSLIGREREMGPMVQSVRQFMQGPPAEADAALRAAGHTIPWGQDYATPAGFCATAWKLFAPPPPAH
jgi:hypothetical protein